MNCAIVIRSYFRDFRWLRHCLRGICRFAHGFGAVIVIMPQSSLERLPWQTIGDEHVLASEEFEDDYLGQQVTKLYADQLTDADYICHLDSDCVLRRPVAPTDLLVGGKVCIPFTPYIQVPFERPWQRVTEKFLRHSVEHSFMRRLPLVYPRWLYPELRRCSARLHGQELRDYILCQPPRGFSEFNALGAFAYYHHHEAFTWQPVAPDAPNEQLCKWYWSWGGLRPEILAEIEQILAADE
jgi:hypothetical protein